MYRTILLAAFCALAVNFGSFPAQAEDGVSYSKKKQGMVHFVEEGQEEAETAAAEATDATEAANPAEIEPAAGVEEEEQSEENKAADMIKLPRK